MTGFYYEQTIPLKSLSSNGWAEIRLFCVVKTSTFSEAE